MGKGKDKTLWNLDEDHNQLKAVIDSKTSGLARIDKDIARRLGEIAFDMVIKQSTKQPQPLTKKGLKETIKQARKELVVWRSDCHQEILHGYAEKLTPSKSLELKGAVRIRIEELLEKHDIFTLHRINQAIDCAKKRVARQLKHSSTICIISMDANPDLQHGEDDDMVECLAIWEWLDSKTSQISGGKDVLKYVWEDITLEELATRLECDVLEASEYCDQVLAKLRTHWNQDRLGE